MHCATPRVDCFEPSADGLENRLTSATSGRPCWFGDGLSDGEELLGTRGPLTNPLNPDTDGDGYSDFREIVLGKNPLDPDDTARLGSLTLPWFKNN